MTWTLADHANFRTAATKLWHQSDGYAALGFDPDEAAGWASLGYLPGGPAG